jgi:cytochrome c-type biogenesis protein CcmE
MRLACLTTRPVARFLSSASLFLLLTFATAAAETTVSSILTDPAQFDGKNITVRGIATAVKPTVSRRGNPYTTLRLQDGGSAITVYMQGHLPATNGERVEVTGVFQTIKRVGSYTFYNEIEAQSITPAWR